MLLNAVADYLESAKDGGAMDESKVSEVFFLRAMSFIIRIPASTLLSELLHR